MPTFIAVLKDLWEFIFGEFFSATSKSPFQVITPVVSPVVTKPLSLPSAPLVPVLTAPEMAVGLQGEKAYVVVPNARLLQRPVISFDGAIQTLPYAASVQILGYEGRFAHVTYKALTGWLLKDTLALHAQEVFPVFHTGEIYSEQHPDTKKLRDSTNDEFLAGELCLALQSVEFVQYRLKEAARVIDWPTTRPRLAGTWQNILKGKLGIQIGIHPKTGAVLEYTKPDGTGFVGYTKEVHVDEAIVIEGVGRLIEGEYREELVSKDEWHEWRPVWIQMQ